MVIQIELLNKLRDFGLNTYEARIWTALLTKGISTAGELSDIANVPRSRSYDVLESLEKKGFVIMKVGKPIKYIAVPPEEVIERVKRKLNQESEERAVLIDELKSTKLFDELVLLHDSGIEMINPSDLTGSFRGRDNLYNHMDSMIKRAKKSITIMTTEQGILREQERFKRALKKAKQKGIDIYITAPLTKNNKSNITSLKKISEIRNSFHNGRFMIVDDDELLFMIVDDKKTHPNYDAGVWVKSKNFVNLFNELFKSYYLKIPFEK